MTRSEIRKAIEKVLKPVGTGPIPGFYADKVMEAIEPALTFEPEVVNMSAELHGVGRLG